MKKYKTSVIKLLIGFVILALLVGAIFIYVEIVYLLVGEEKALAVAIFGPMSVAFAYMLGDLFYKR